MSNLQQIRAAFSAQAENFSQPGQTLSDPHLLSWMVAALDLGPAIQALDVAAGTGIHSAALAPHLRNVVALDATPAMIHKGIRSAGQAGFSNVAFVLGLAQQLPVAANTFDRVACRFAVHHFPDPAKAVLEMTRACSLGGKVILIDLVSPDNDQLADSYNHLETLRDPSHVRALTIQELEGLLLQSGLTLRPSISRAIPVQVNRWLGLTNTDETRAQVICEALLAELTGSKATGMRPFMAQEGLHFHQTWAIAVGQK